MKKIVLITGANGFVGKALCERMLSENWHVRGAVRSRNAASGLPPGVEVFQIETIGPNTDWSKALAGVDCVVHLAAKVHVMNDAAEEPLALFRWINVEGTAYLAQKAAASGVRRFLYLSSVKIHGEGRSVPYKENHELKPQDPYSLSKLEAEQLLYKISDKTGIKVTVVRPPLVYGPNVKANFLRLLKVVDHGAPLPLASINNRRSFIYLGNLVDAIVVCIKHPKAAGNIYLVSDGEDISTPELIRRISAKLGRPARLFPFPPVILKLPGIIARKSIVIDRLLCSLTIDCSKIRRELNWQAPFSMEQGLRETAKWYKNRGLN